IKQVKLLFYSYGAVENVPSSILIGDLDPGASTTISVPIKIREDATSGNYLFKIEATGFVDATSSSGASEYNEKSATVVLNVINSPLITLETEKTVIGDKENFNLIIQNNGGNAKNLKISVSDEFAIEGTDKVYVGEVEKYKEVNFVLDSSNAKAGINDVEFVLEYNNELGESIIETKQLRLNIVKEDSILIITQESKIVSNIKDKLVLNVKNKGKRIDNVKISFPNEDVKFTDVDKIDLGTMEAGEERTVEVWVFALLNPGSNQVDTKLEWRENGEVKTDDIKLPLTIDSDTSIGIYLQAKPTPLTTNQEHTLTVLVSNLGSYMINNVEVQVESETMSLLDIQSSEYIGELKNDDFSTVQFKIKPNNLGTQNISFNVKYKDQTGEWKTEKITKEIVVYAGEGDGSGIWMLLILVIVIGAGVWYFKFRKK
ncbi:MAG: hypothetical protein PHU63_01320, partial [Candidatus ainarchaeum sp.]|nr:hypothetical protein [Candidatus ainarchaeum sp.]